MSWRPGDDWDRYVYRSFGDRWTLLGPNGELVMESADSREVWKRAVDLARSNPPSRIDLIDEHGMRVADTYFADDSLES